MRMLKAYPENFHVEKCQQEYQSWGVSREHLSHRTERMKKAKLEMEG